MLPNRLRWECGDLTLTALRSAVLWWVSMLGSLVVVVVDIVSQSVARARGCAAIRQVDAAVLGVVLVLVNARHSGVLKEPLS